jgi:gas vesicle protein
MTDMRDQASTSGGMFLLGVVAGALVAPKAGAEMRRDLTAGWSSLRDAAARRYRELADRAGVQVENLDEKAGQFADQLEASAREAIDTASAQLAAAPARVATALREAGTAAGPINGRPS